MADEAAERRKGRGRLIGAGLTALAAALIAGLWSQRGPIATHFVDQALARKGVPARYRITRFGTASQRLEDIVIGDPAAPDLVAKWADLRMSLGLNGVELHGIAAGGVRLRGRIVDGRLSLGALDRLTGPSGGAPFALPDITLALTDARMRLVTAAGDIGIAIDGGGRLTDGFSGRVTASAPALAIGGCRIERPRALLQLAIRQRRPLLAGPLHAEAAVCGASRLAGLHLQADAAATEALDHWTGTAHLVDAQLHTDGGTADRLAGTIAFDLAGGRSAGPVSLTANGVRTPTATVQRAAFEGRYGVDLRNGSATLDGTATVRDARLDGRMRTELVRTLDIAGRGSPAAPLLGSFGRALAAAGDGIGGRAQIAMARGPNGGQVSLASAEIASRSGATLSFAGNDALGFGWGARAATLRSGGIATLSGGGIPRSSLVFARYRGGMSGAAEIAGFEARGARLASLRVQFARAGGTLRFSGKPVLDGPLGSGRVERLTLPIDGQLTAGGALRVNPGCAEFGFATLAIAGITLEDGRLPLCPLGPALLVRSASGAITGGGAVRGARVRGRIGAQPFTIAAESLRIPLAQPGFAGERLAIRLGDGGDPTRLDLASLDGRFVAGGISGRYAGADGKIGNVPILVQDGAGGWALIDGRLALDGAVRVADADVSPRFKPLKTDDVRLTLADGQVRATGTLREPATSTAVSDVVIRHDLRDGNGDAILSVPGLAFTPKLQPDAITPLTTGVIADVRGTLSGEGRIRWDARGASSDGAFGTGAMDLAAAFGPVKGLATTLRFDDLLGLHSPPGQVATVKEVNPGIAVTGGTVRYQVLGPDRVAVEGARWPFAGGALTLEPTMLDFGKDTERRLTFTVDGMDAARFVQQFEFDNIAVTGTFDGVVPMIFGADGGRIKGGRLTVRPGGGTLAYVGEISSAALGRFGKLAFDALKSMRYSNLSIALDGSLDGEVVSQVLFDGTNQTPREAVERHGLLSQFANLPFRFRISVRAPFRGLLNSAESLNDPRGLISRSLGRDAAVVQP